MGECLHSVLMTLFGIAEFNKFDHQQLLDILELKKYCVKVLSFKSYFYFSTSSASKCSWTLFSQRRAFLSSQASVPIPQDSAFGSSSNFPLPSLKYSFLFSWREHIFALCPDCFMPPVLGAFWWLNSGICSWAILFSSGSFLLKASWSPLFDCIC